MCKREREKKDADEDQGGCFHDVSLCVLKVNKCDGVKASNKFSPRGERFGGKAMHGRESKDDRKGRKSRESVGIVGGNTRKWGNSEYSNYS